MEILLFLIGSGVGVLSGFFGIGGGTVLIPILLLIGFEMKDAVGISVMQMVFSSIYGSYLNLKKGSLELNDGLLVGFGGFAGGYLSGYLTPYIPSIALKVLFILFVIFALVRISTSKVESSNEASKSVSKILLFFIGFGIGLVAISIGVGGSIVLTPILSGFLSYSIKSAVSSGLFFVVFSSIAGFIGRVLNGEIDFQSGLIVGLGSLIGVWVGISLKDIVTNKNHKRFIIAMYSFILLIMIYKMFVI